MSHRFGQKDYTYAEVDGHIIETWLHNCVQGGFFEKITAIDGKEVSCEPLGYGTL